MSSNNILQKTLLEFGLNEKEAKVYLSLLELEIASAQEIAKTANLNRSSVYVTLESLKQKGLIGISDDKKVLQYLASSPDILMSMAQDRSEKENNIKNKLNEILPNLKALHKDTKAKPKTRVFEGKEGLINAMIEALEDNKDKEVRVFSSGENILKLIHQDMKMWAQKRVELGIFFWGIYVDTEATRKISNTIPKLYKVVFLPKDHNILLPIDMLIFDNKVGYLVSNNKKITTIVIESAEIASNMKKLFDLSFDGVVKSGGEIKSHFAKN